MSEKDLEAARRGFEAISEAYETGDFSGKLLKTIREICEPDVVLQPSGMFPEQEEMRGHQGMVRFIAGQAEAFDGMWIEAEEFIEAGDKLVIPIRFGGRARHTGIDVEFSVTHLSTYREGKLVRDEIYATKEEALEAAGHKGN